MVSNILVFGFCVRGTRLHNQLLCFVRLTIVFARSLSFRAVDIYICWKFNNPAWLGFMQMGDLHCEWCGLQRPKHAPWASFRHQSLALFANIFYCASSNQIHRVQSAGRAAVWMLIIVFKSGVASTKAVVRILNKCCCNFIAVVSGSPKTRAPLQLLQFGWLNRSVFALLIYANDIYDYYYSLSFAIDLILNLRLSFLLQMPRSFLVKTSYPPREMSPPLTPSPTSVIRRHSPSAFSPVNKHRYTELGKIYISSHNKTFYLLMGGNFMF
jgi:hypothetical protein